MIPNNYYGVASRQVSLLGCNIIKIDGFFLGAVADRYLQVFDSCTTPEAGAVPKRQWPISQVSAFYFEMERGELRLGEGCFVGISSTDGTYTASADTMDITLESDAPLISGLTVVGDKTTDVVTRVLWDAATGAAGLKRLRQLIITENGTAAGVICLHAIAGIPWNFALIKPLPLSGTVKLNFGDNYCPYAIGSDGLVYMGCQVTVTSAAPSGSAGMPFVAAHSKICAVIK